VALICHAHNIEQEKHTKSQSSTRLDLISKVQSKTRQQFMGVTLAINESATPDRVQTIQAGSDPRWEGGKEIATPTTVESHFIHHNFLQFGKKHSRYKIISSSTVLSNQCCGVLFIALTVAKPLCDLITKYY